METVFQLARVRRPSTSSSLPSLSSPTSPVSNPPWTLEVSEFTRTLLEDISQPVVVISYLSLDREVRDALWGAFKDVYGWQVQSTTTGGQEDARKMSLGIWGWISPPDTSLDDDKEVTAGAAPISTGGGGGSLMGVRKIYLLYGGEYDDEDFEEDGGMIDVEEGLTKGEQKAVQDLDLESVEKVVWSLLSLCSTYLTVVSPGLEATRKEMERLSGFVRPLIGVRTERSSGVRERAVLDWRWVGQDIVIQDQDRDLNLDGHKDDGRMILESLLEDCHAEDQEAENGTLLLDTICKAFGGIKCKPPMPVGMEWSRRGSEVDAIRAEAETGTFRILCDYSVDDNKAEKRFQWIRRLWRSFDSFHEVEDGGGAVEYPRVFSGAILCSRIQACLTHLNKLPHPYLSLHHLPIQQFNTKELQTTLQDLIRERALSIGMRTYHREMNAFLDRKPIPLPWHTLAMVHLRAQSIACEEIEARFWAVGEGDVRGGLRNVMKEFRRPCVVTEANSDDDNDAGGGAGKKEGGGHKKDEVKKVKEGKSKGGEGMVVPGGGLYLEYYSANAAALQEHHLCSLDELWQVMLKNRLPGVKDGVGGGIGIVGEEGGEGGEGGGAAVEGSSSGLAKNVSQIKDYTDFLLAVDQVRRGYLESCIPSPEALSVLENLDEMQQSESILFLQTLASSPANTSVTATATGTQQQPASAKGVPSKRYSITNHPTVALNGRELMIHPAAGDDSRISNTSGSSGISGGGMMGSGSRRSSTTQGMDGAPTTELEQQIADILLSKRGRRGSRDDSGDVSRTMEISSRKSMVNTRSTSRGGKRGSAMSLFQGIINGAKAGQTTMASAVRKKDEDKAVVQFGWTFHLRHANSLQHAWIWDWLSTHAGSSHQNVVACDNKIYTASKWMILPARDTIASRTWPGTGKQKEWRVAYGDRVWLVSYWYSTRNATMELPEYLPRARGGPCGHIVPYGETFVICRTCPADVLCMRCFRASDHVDHSMYLQCSWGDSVCVCGDPSRLEEGGHGHSHHGLHCSMHSAEPERAYSGLAKGRPCGIVFLPGETVYKCKSCLIDEEDDKALCVRCFHSHDHFGHDVVVQLAEGGSHCSCEDGYSWREDLICSYHSPGELELEYRPKAISPGAHSTTTKAESKDSLAIVATTDREEHRCEHVFQQGEDIYHCHDCSIHEGVALCSRCFFSSNCVTHQWRAGQFSNGALSNKRGSNSTVGSGSGLVDDALATVVDGLGISQGGFGSISTSSSHPLVQQQQDEPEDEEDIIVSCGCGDPKLFRKAIDCNYHLPRVFRPVPQLHHCGYLFQISEIMIRCRTCHVFNVEGEEEEDVWICGRCFDPTLHVDHETEETVNHWNEGLYCRCGDPTILRGGVETVAGTKMKCRDDHNRQTVLCATEIKNGMFFYRCQSCQINAKWVFCESCFVLEAHEGHSYERRLCASVAGEEMKGLWCGCGENSAFRCATHCRKHESVGGTNVVLRCQYYARAGEWISFCRDCYPSKEGIEGVGGYLCQRCRESSDHSGHTHEWVQLEEDMVISCACGSRRRTLPPEEEDEDVEQEERTTALGQSPSSRPSLCGYHTMAYKTTPSTTLFLHSSRDNQPSNHHHDEEDRSEVSGCKYHDSDNDWILHRAPPSSTSPSSTPHPSSKEDWFLRWKDMVWLEHANTGKYFSSMAGYKNGQGFQEVVCADDMDEENGGDGDHEWIVEETTWVRQHILGQ